MPFHNRPIDAGDPFIPEDFRLQGQVQEQEQPEPTRDELIRAGAALTPTGSLWAKGTDAEPDPDFEPDWKTLDQKYDPYIDELGDAESEDEFINIQRRIDDSLKAQTTLAQGGMAGLGWGMATQMVDPITLPLWFATPTKLLQGAGVARTGLVVGGMATAEATAGEAILQANDPTRKAADSFATIAGSAVIGSVLGWGGGYIAQTLGQQKVRKLVEAVNEEMDDLARTRRALDEAPSMGAASSVTSLAQERPIANPARYVTLTSPTGRLAYDNVSASASRFVDELTPHNIIKKKHLEGVAPDHAPLATAVEQAKTSATSDVIKAVKQARRDLKQRGIRLSEDEISQLAGQAARRGDDFKYPEVAKVAQTFRKHVDDWTDRAVSLKILNPDDFNQDLALSYFPRLYDVDAISRNYQHWRTLLGNHFKASDNSLEAGEIERLVDEITMTLRGTPVGRLSVGPYESASTQTGHFKQRTLAIWDVQLEPFMVDDIRSVTRAYMQSVSPEILLRERYGVDNVVNIDGIPSIRSVEESIKSEYSLAIQTAADAGKNVTKLEKQRDQAFKDIRHIMAKITGMDAPTYGDSIGQFAARASTEARSYMAASSLGNIVLASMADVANVILQHGLANFIKTRPAAWKMGKLSNSAKQDFDALAVGMDTLMSTRMMKIADIEDTPATTTAASFGSTRVAPAMFKYTLANVYNRMAKRGASVAAQNRLISDALKYDKLSKFRRAKLAQVGINKDWARRIRENHELQDQKSFQGAYWADLDKWDAGTAERFSQIIHREADTTIVTPQPGDTGILLDNAVGKFITQFKKTVIGMQLQIMTPMAQRLARGDLTVLNALTAMVALGMAQEQLRMAIRHRFDMDAIREEMDQLTVADWIRAGIDRSGAVGFVTEGFNFADHFTRGQMSNAMGMSESSRYYFRNSGFGSLVPALGYLDDAGELMGAPFKEEGFTTRDLHTMRRFVPFQNAYYAAWLFDEVEKATGEALDLPEGKKRERRYAKQNVKF